jgi:hypothetical protein
MKSVIEVSPQMQLDRSESMRSIIKQYYIYVVLALIVIVFSLMKLDQVELSLGGATSLAQTVSSTCCERQFPSSF